MSTKTDERYWEGPSMKSRLRILVSSAETDGELLKIEFENQPGDVPPPYHFHPEQEETFKVVQGRLTLKLDGEEREVGEGESICIPTNTPHTFWNASSAPVRFISEHRPALGFEGFITTLYDLDYDGKSNSKGTPSLLQLMTMLKSRNGEQIMAGPPAFVQNLGAAVLGTIGGWFGYRSTYVTERYRDMLERE